MVSAAMLNLHMTVHLRRKFYKRGQTHQHTKWKSSGKARTWMNERIIGFEPGQQASAEVYTIELFRFD